MNRPLPSRSPGSRYQAVPAHRAAPAFPWLPFPIVIREGLFYQPMKRYCDGKVVENLDNIWLDCIGGTIS